MVKVVGGKRGLGSGGGWKVDRGEETEAVGAGGRLGRQNR